MSVAILVVANSVYVLVVLLVQGRIVQAMSEMSEVRRNLASWA